MLDDMVPVLISWPFDSKFSSPAIRLQARNRPLITCLFVTLLPVASLDVQVHSWQCLQVESSFALSRRPVDPALSRALSQRQDGLILDPALRLGFQNVGCQLSQSRQRARQSPLPVQLRHSRFAVLHLFSFRGHRHENALGPTQ